MDNMQTSSSLPMLFLSFASFALGAPQTHAIRRISTTVSTPILQTPDNLLHIRDDDDDDDPSRAGEQNTYYSIVLVAVALFLAVILVYTIIRRRKKAELRARARLVSDMEAAQGQRAVQANTRGHRGWAVQMVNWGVTGEGRVHSERTNRGVRLEGLDLDERGEAPPPYEPKRDAIGERTNGREGRGSANPDEDGNKAPKYEDVVLEVPEPAHHSNTRWREESRIGMNVASAPGVATPGQAAAPR